MNLCKLCREPIWNFICINCLEKDILERIPGNLRRGFSEFHRRLSYYFRSKTDRFIPCLKCRISDAPHICIPCYLNELNSWFRENGLLGKVKENLSLDFEALERNLKGHSALPITETRNRRRNSGICDECGEYSENLVLFNSEWVCTECRSMLE